MDVHRLPRPAGGNGVLPRGWALQGLSGAADVIHEAVHGVLAEHVHAAARSGSAPTAGDPGGRGISVVRAAAWTT